MGKHFNFLRSLYFFKNLTDDDIIFVESSVQAESIPAKTILFNEYDPADKFYMVLRGSIEIWRNYGKEDQTLLAIEKAGHIFGEMALVDDLPRSATVISHEDSDLLFINHEDFEKIMGERTNITLAILRSLALMVRTASTEFIKNLSEQNKELQKTLSELKIAQDALVRTERFSNLGKFASFVLHDLRNPLSAIRGYAELTILEDEEQAALTEYAKKIIHEADFLNRFANDILDYSRGDIRLRMTQISPDSIITKVKTYLQDQMSRRNIQMKCSNSVVKPLLCDEDRIVRALVNIGDNARKASGSNSTVMLECTEKDGFVIFSVTDQGEGMSPEVLSQIFEPFYSSSKQGGTGLGMLIVKNVIEAHKGFIEIESEIGKGTCVSLRLPFKPE